MRASVTSARALLFGLGVMGATTGLIGVVPVTASAQAPGTDLVVTASSTGEETLEGDFVDAAGNLRGDGPEDVLVRRGDTFVVQGHEGISFTFDDPGDTVLVGNWDGDTSGPDAPRPLTTDT